MKMINGMAGSSRGGIGILIISMLAANV